jgi:hypothetical protein
MVPGVNLGVLMLKTFQPSSGAVVSNQDIFFVVMEFLYSLRYSLPPTTNREDPTEVRVDDDDMLSVVSLLM